MRVIGRIIRVNTGTVGKGKNIGSEWQQLDIEGLRVFVPDDLQNGFCRGQMVRCELMYQGNRKREDEAGNINYDQNYELMTIEILPEPSF